MKQSTTAIPSHIVTTGNSYRTGCDNLTKQDAHDFIAAVKADNGQELEWEEARQIAEEAIKFAKLVNIDKR